MDVAMDAMSGGNSQPCMGSVVEALRFSERDTELDIDAVREISAYWEQVRGLYAAFETGLDAPASEVYLHEMPGGQLTNLKAQAKSMGLDEKWDEIARTYADVNLMFGDIPKVTPSSKVVGDMALLMVSMGITRDDVENPEVDVAFPESVVDMMRGALGQPYGGWPEGIQSKILKGEKPLETRPGATLAAVDLEAERQVAADALGLDTIDDEDLCAHLMYPTVFREYMERHAVYGPVRTVPTTAFFYGMKPREEISVEIDPGKTLEIRLLAIGQTHDDGQVRLFFELNGQPRTIRVPDRHAAATVVRRQAADPGNPCHVPAPMPGVIATVAVKAGQHVLQGDLLLTIEAMKMETGIHAERNGTILSVNVSSGDQVDAKDLLVELDEA